MKNKKLKFIVIILISIGIFGLGYKFIWKNYENISQKNYKIDIKKIAITTPADDDIFYKNLKEDYNGFKLIFVSAEVINNTQQNFDNLSYKLTTSNNNKYTRASSYVTNNEEFIENYYKINNKIFSNSTEDLLGGKTKRIIVGFMIPENELINDTTFRLNIDSFDIKYEDVMNLEFNSSEIIKSNSMKELYKDDELEKAEQTLSLAYFSSLYNWQNSMAYFEIAYNYNNEKIFTTAFAAIKVFAETSDDYISWNGRKIEDENGYKLNFDKAKEFYPDIAEQIEGAKNTVNQILELYPSYNGKIKSLDKNKLLQIDSGVVNNIIKIKEFFELRYS